MLEHRLGVLDGTMLAEKAKVERELQSRFEDQLQQLHQRHEEVSIALQALCNEHEQVANVLGQIFPVALVEFQQSGLLQMAQLMTGEISERITELEQKSSTLEAELEAVKVQNGSMGQAVRSMGELNVKLEAELESVLAELEKQATNRVSRPFLRPLAKQCNVLRQQLDKVNH